VGEVRLDGVELINSVDAEKRGVITAPLNGITFTTMYPPRSEETVV
jgi:hypothetical protein